MSSQKHTRQHRERAGRRAENWAALYLRIKGYRLLERRYKTHSGEIDIIASKGSTLAIIEVKKRKTLKSAQDSLTPKARSRIERAAKSYISRERSVRDLAVRFDAVFITTPFRITHHIDLWRGH